MKGVKTTIIFMFTVFLISKGTVRAERMSGGRIGKYWFINTDVSDVLKSPLYYEGYTLGGGTIKEPLGLEIALGYLFPTQNISLMGFVSFTLQYNFWLKEKISPYVGGGVDVYGFWAKASNFYAGSPSGGSGPGVHIVSGVKFLITHRIGCDFATRYVFCKPAGVDFSGFLLSVAFTYKHKQ